MPDTAPNCRTRRHPDTARNRPVGRRWASINETAEYLGVGIRTVRYMIADGRLTAYHGLGDRLIRLDLSEVDAAMKAAAG